VYVLKPAFVRAIHSQRTCLPGLSQRTLTVVFVPTPTVKLRGRYYSERAVIITVSEAAQLLSPGLVSSLQSITPWKIC